MKRAADMDSLNTVVLAWASGKTGTALPPLQTTGKYSPSMPPPPAAGSQKVRMGVVFIDPRLDQVAPLSVEERKPVCRLQAVLAGTHQGASE